MHETFVDIVECNISRNNHISYNVWPSACLVSGYVVLA